MDKILDTFSVRERNEAPFRFCGKEVVQDDDYNITVTAKDNCEKIVRSTSAKNVAAPTRTLLTRRLAYEASLHHWHGSQDRLRQVSRIAHPSSRVLQGTVLLKTSVSATRCWNTRIRGRTRASTFHPQVSAGMMPWCARSPMPRSATRLSRLTVFLSQDAVNKAILFASRLRTW